MEDRYYELLKDAASAIDSGNLASALAMADQLIAAKSYSPFPRIFRVDILLRLGRPADALPDARSAVQQGPHLPEAHWALAHVAWNLDRNSETQEAFERALEYSHRHCRILEDYARFLLERRSPKLAEAAASELVTKAPQSSQAWAILGASRLMLNNHAEAEQALKRALNIDPHNSWAKANLAWLLQRSGQTTKADAVIKLLKDEPLTLTGFILQEQAKEQQISQKLFERKEFADEFFGGPRNRYGVVWQVIKWTFLAAVVVFSIYWAITSKTILGLSPLLSIAVYLGFRRILDR